MEEVQRKCPNKLLKANLQMLKLAHLISLGKGNQFDLALEAIGLFTTFSKILCLDGEAVALLVKAWIEREVNKNPSLSSTVEFINSRTKLWKLDALKEHNLSSIFWVAKNAKIPFHKLDILD